MFLEGFERFLQICLVGLTYQMADLDTSERVILGTESTRIDAFPKIVSPRAGLPHETYPFWVAAYRPVHGPGHQPMSAVAWQSICPADQPYASYG